MEPFLAEVRIFAGNFAPRGWAFCDGQLLPISQYSAVFSLVGTIYGGDGRTTFGLPDLRGRTAIHPGNGPGLSSYSLGEKGGRETVALTISEMPAHNHSTAVEIQVNTETSDQTEGGGHSFGTAGTNIFNANAPEEAMSADTTKVTQSTVGGGQSFDIRSPYLGINHIFALQGTFPSRS